MIHITYILLGTVTGLLSGFLGLGGGLVIIPALIYIFGMTQQQAQGTSLAMMIPPITLLAAIRYYLNGNVRVGVALFLAIGFLVGGLLGAHIAQYLPGIILRRAFGVVMLFAALKMIFF